MKNLKITTRLAISIVFLLGALLFLVHAYFTAQQSEVVALRRELRGVEVLRQLTHTAEAVSHYRISLFRIQAGEAGYESDAKTAFDTADAEMKRMLALYAEHAQELHFTPDALALRHRSDISDAEFDSLWQKISDAGYAEAAMEDYDELFKRMMLLVEHTTETSGLVADEDLGSYALISTITQHVSEVIMRTLGSEGAGYNAVVEGRPAAQIAQLRSWDYGTFLKRDNFRLVRRGIEASDYYEITPTESLGAIDSRLRSAYDNYLRYGTRYANLRIAMGEGRIISHADYLESGHGFTKAMFEIWNAGADKLTYLLQMRLEKTQRALNYAMIVTVAGILLAIGFFIYVTRGIVTSLRDIENAMDRVANGELDLEVPHLQNRDEIGSMARTLERFRRSYWWLRDEA